jgi:phosphoenolpyruvate synthase/pyruvate phosphate dikinase
MALRIRAYKGLKREMAVETIVAGMQACNGILHGLNEQLSTEEVSQIASSLRRLRKQGKGIILRCRETFPYMIPVLSEVEGIISPNTTSRTKGHSAEFCREEGKIFVVADESGWEELEGYEGEKILVDSGRKKIILDPDRRVFQKATARCRVQPEIRAIGELIQQGRHISLLSTVPEPINACGDFSYFCRQEQLMMSKGNSPWDLLRRSRRECEHILHTIWKEYANRVQPGTAVVFRSHDARSDEYPGSPVAHEPNPQLGLHGPSLFERFPDLLQAEVTAIAKIRAENDDKKITYLLPFVRNSKEIRRAREALGHAVAKASLSKDAVELAVMYETPALPYLMDELRAARVKTIWIGTKDLLMSFLMVDRDNPNRKLQDYLKLLYDNGETNSAFIEYLNENIKRMIEGGFHVIMYSLASEVPIFVKYLSRQVGFLLSKGSVKQAITQLEF